MSRAEQALPRGAGPAAATPAAATAEERRKERGARGRGGGRGRAGRSDGHNDLVAVDRAKCAQHAVRDVHARSRRGRGRAAAAAAADAAAARGGRARGACKRVLRRERKKLRADRNKARDPRLQLRVGAEAQQREARGVDERGPQPVSAEAARKVGPADNVAGGDCAQGEEGWRAGRGVSARARGR